MGFFDSCNLSGANFTNSSLNQVNFSDSKLQSLNFTNIRNVVDIQFHPNSTVDNIILDHNHLNDEEIKYKIKSTLFDKCTNWGFQKTLGNAPVFTASWIGLAVTTLLLSALIYLNHNLIFTTEVISEYPIPMPSRLVWFMFSTLSLFIGSIIFQNACPVDVQEYSISKWVREIRKSRFQYEHMKIVNPIRRFFAFIFMFGGGAVIFGLFAERLFKIVKELLN